MNLIEFPEQMYVIAKDQEEYLPMPAHVDKDGCVTCCWQLSWKERFRLLITGKIWHQILTYNTPLQPQLLTTEKSCLNIN